MMLYLFSVYALVVIAVSIVALVVLMVSYVSIWSAMFIARSLQSAGANLLTALKPAATDLSPIRVPDDFVQE
jgi:hypothetical protein